MHQINDRSAPCSKNIITQLCYYGKKIVEYVQICVFCLLNDSLTWILYVKESFYVQSVGFESLDEVGNSVC